jgi:hypothetical protein
MRFTTLATALLAGAATASPVEKRQSSGTAGFAQGQPISANGNGASLLGKISNSLCNIVY